MDMNKYWQGLSADAKVFPITNNLKAPDIYIDDNLFLNKGKEGEFHMSFPDSNIERDRVFHGIIHEGTQDHIIVYNKEANEWYLLPLLYLNYTVFKDIPNYS